MGPGASSGVPHPIGVYEIHKETAMDAIEKQAVRSARIVMRTPEANLSAHARVGREMVEMKLRRQLTQPEGLKYIKIFLLIIQKNRK